MGKYMAFLRAINVGGHTVKMDHLRNLFEDMGFTNVETFIASGNVIFDSDIKNKKALEQKIEGRLFEALGYEAATFIRSSNELAEIAKFISEKEPEINKDGYSVYVAFLTEPPDAVAEKNLMALQTQLNKFQINGQELYWYCRTTFSDSGFTGAAFEKILGMPLTMRNSTTVKKIAAKYA